MKAVDALTRDLQWAMEAQVVNVERIDDQRLVRAVEELYRDDLTEQVMRVARPAPPRRRSGAAVALDRRRRRATSRRASPSGSSRCGSASRPTARCWPSTTMRDEAVRAAARAPAGPRAGSSTPGTRSPACRSSATARSSTRCPTTCRAGWPTGMARKETDYATIRLLASVVAFPLFWGLETWLVVRGWPGRGGRWPSRSRCRSRARSRIVT